MPIVLGHNAVILVWMLVMLLDPLTQLLFADEQVKPVLRSVHLRNQGETIHELIALGTQMCAEPLKGNCG